MDLPGSRLARHPAAGGQSHKRQDFATFRAKAAAARLAVECSTAQSHPPRPCIVMAKTGRKLKDALDHQRGVDRKKEAQLKQQRKQEKQVEKKRRAKEQVQEEIDDGGGDVAGVEKNGVAQEGTEDQEADGVVLNGGEGLENGEGEEQWSTLR